MALFSGTNSECGGTAKIVPIMAMMVISLGEVLATSLNPCDIVKKNQRVVLADRSVNGTWFFLVNSSFCDFFRE